MKTSVRDALTYIKKANGMPYTEELNNKVRNFLYSLPRNPRNDEYMQVTVKDYHEGWFAVVQYGEGQDGKMYVEVVDGDNMDDSKHRAKSNKEALEVLKQLKEIEYPSDFDQYWNMSDDHQYWSKMSDMHREAVSKENKLLARL